VDSPCKGILEILEISKKKKIINPNLEAKPISLDVAKFVDHDILLKLFNAE